MKTKEEIEIIRADALAGDSGAQNSLGCAYASGDGVVKDLKEAFMWFEKAAQNGDKYGQYNAGLYYQNGWGCVKNVSKAIEWYEKSAMQGYGKAAHSLGKIHEKGDNYESEFNPNAACDSNLIGKALGRVLYAQRHYDEAFFWYNVGARVYDENSIYDVARCYEKGIGTPKCLFRAYELYKKSKSPEAKKSLNDLLKTYNPLLDSGLLHFDIIGKNPYRILGVFSNSTEREIRANKSKLDVMARVGQSPTFETDHILPCNVSDNIETLQSRIKFCESSELDILLRINKDSQEKLQDWFEVEKTNPEWNVLPDRSIENIQEAIQKIATDVERVKYALFWFCNYSTADKKAFEDLSEHNQSWFVAYVNSSEFPTLINQAVLSWTNRNNERAIEETLKFIADDKCREEFVTAVTSGRIQLSKDELYVIFLDALFDFPEEELSLYNLTEKRIKNKFIEIGKDYYFKKLFDAIVAPIEDLLHIAEAKDSNDWIKSKSAYENAACIANKTKKQLQYFIGEDYYQYELFCNKIALIFLEFGIHYNNDNTEDYDAPRIALKFAKLANSIAIDETLLERCKKNIDIFKNNTNITQTEKALEVIDEKIKKIDGIRVTFSEIETTLKSITAYLDVIRDHAGKDSAIYLNESSRVVNIFLNRVIDICNYSKSFFTDSGAAPILKQLQKMDMTSETKQRLERNIKTLSSHLSAVLGEGAWERVSANQEKKGNKCISNDDIQIKAPNSVRAGETFLVSITIKGKYERIDSPQTTNLTLVDGPTTSFSETKTFGLQTKLKEEKGYSTTFSYHYRAIEKGIAQINVKNCTDNGKRSIGRCVTIQVQEQIPKKTTETKSSKRKRRKLLYISLVCLLLTIITVLSVLLFRQDGLMLTKSTISLLSIGGIFIISTFLFSYSLWNLEDGHYKHLGIVENLKGVGISAFSSLFIALIVGWAISALTCWLSPSVIVVGADNSHEKYQLLGKSQGRFLSNNSLYIQNNTNETIFLVGVYYSSRFSNSWNNNDIIVEIPSNGLTKIDKEPNCYFEVPPQTITYRTRNYSASSSGKYQWFLLDMQLLNQYQTYGK